MIRQSYLESSWFWTPGNAITWQPAYDLVLQHKQPIFIPLPRWLTRVSSMRQALYAARDWLRINVGEPYSTLEPWPIRVLAQERNGKPGVLLSYRKAVGSRASWGKNYATITADGREVWQHGPPE